MLYITLFLAGALSHSMMVQGKPPDKATLLVGVWEVSKSKFAPKESTLELTKDGRVIITATVADKMQQREGTYKFTGTKLVISVMVDTETYTETYEVTKLTADSLTLRDSSNSYDDFIRKGVLKK